LTASSIWEFHLPVPAGDRRPRRLAPLTSKPVSAWWNLRDRCGSALPAH